MIGGCLASLPSPEVGQPWPQPNPIYRGHRPVMLIWGVASEALRDIITGFLNEVRFD